MTSVVGALPNGGLLPKVSHISLLFHFSISLQAMFLMSWRLSKLAEAGTMSHEQASLVKAWNTLRGREVCS